ncbi:ZIP family metal transporter [Candidatus Nitrotoga fabula]|uniref:Zinc transporter, ZIP family n=1 Tax=Candidatus Nitrotoga fabula TaxID=2182327 RepID=A0A916BF33_9PROT|nr:ZIP family metal transporter [Candidatus Nitrotoga fabula]CAE6729827.1 Zinc transporter, ZIP family [Candidatus Nitrotoga fabula]
MSILAWIIASCIAGGTLSIVCATFFALGNRTQNYLSGMVSYAIGALLGAVFLNILPEAIHLAPNVAVLSGTVLFGILLFFILEKLVLWRHCHHEHCEAHVTHEPGHGFDNGRSGMLIIIGDTFHNFVDGIIIAAAFLTDVNLGIVAALAIIAHEIPQEVGDFAILLYSGYSKLRAFQLNLISSFSSVAGGILGYFTLQTMQSWIPTLLALAAASMIYIAVADLIPGLHKRAHLRDTLQQVVLIVLGVGTVWLMSVFMAE